MPIQQVIAYTKNAAQFAQDAAVAGGTLNVPGAATAAIRAVEAACAASMHAHADPHANEGESKTVLEETARILSELAAEAARAAKVVARSSVYNDWGLAEKAASEALQAASTALTVAYAAEIDVTDPSSDLGREAARQVMDHAVAQAEIQTDPDVLLATEALRRSAQWNGDGWSAGGSFS